MTHDELLAKINAELATNYADECGNFPIGLKALHAVVELHKPNKWGDCNGCDNRCGCYEGDIMNYNKWETCPTIEAIEKELA